MGGIPTQTDCSLGELKRGDVEENPKQGKETTKKVAELIEKRNRGGWWINGENISFSNLYAAPKATLDRLQTWNKMCNEALKRQIRIMNLKFN